ncbi:MAG: response regulator [Ignavibacteriales bacterium]|nr:response regulator [Ignavibacteriales bacterium]
MTPGQHINVLLIEDNAAFAKLVKLYLDKYEEAKIEVLWKDNGSEGIEEAERNKEIDVILMDYFLPGINGLEVTKVLKEKNIDHPVIFLTVNKDMNLAVEVMKLGVEDYLVKEEISTPVLPKTIMSVVEKRKFQLEVAELEIRKKRLEAMQELIVGISAEVTSPLKSMKEAVELLLRKEHSEKGVKYLGIIKDNVVRIEAKMEKLHNLKEDKTVQYIKDIRMIDLS